MRSPADEAETIAGDRGPNRSATCRRAASLAIWELTVRRKPSGDPGQVHARLLDALASLPSPWKLQAPTRALPRDAAATTTLRGTFGLGMSASATYLFRSDRHPDTAQFDDVFVFSFDPARVDLAPLADAVLPALVTALDAYRASLSDRALLAKDAAAIAARMRETGVDLDGRHGIHRLSPLAYYDEHLLEAELKLSGHVFVQRARGWVRPFHRGVLVAMPLEPARTGQFETADESLRALAIVGDAVDGGDPLRGLAATGTRLESLLRVLTKGRSRR
jgi:hypothetical protein